MIERRSGTILNMSSVSGWIAPPLYSIYAATKFGVHGFTDALRREVAPFGIKVCGIYPGGANTEFGQHTGNSPSKSIFKAAGFLNVLLGIRRPPDRRPGAPSRAGRYSSHGGTSPIVWLERTFPGLVDWILKVAFVRRLHQGGGQKA